MTTDIPLANLLLTALITFMGMTCVAVPIGVVIAIMIRRTMPFANMITASILAGYIVGFVVLFALLRRLFAEMAWYNAASVSLVITTTMVFVAIYFIKRALFAKAEALSAEQKFTVFGEDARDKPKNLRRRKR